jgi:multiple sugar transport system substrate-binding protein
MTFTRRSVLGAATVLGAAAVTGCDTAPSTPGADGSAGGRLRWWDHFGPLEELQKSTFETFTADTGVQVEYTGYQTARMGEALTLAKQSKQLPDIHSNVGLDLPLRQLIDDGWYQPLQLPSEAESLIADEDRLEGVTTFDGKLYTFPLFNFRQVWAQTYINKTAAERAGLDPAAIPTTYDEFRTACQQVKASGGDAKGMINNLGAPNRIAEQVNYWVQAAGFGGSGGVLYTTGEYAYTDDTYLNLMDFLKSLQVDGLMVEGQFDDNEARTRWAGGQAVFYVDGPWCTGAVKKLSESAVDTIDVGQILVPEAGLQPQVYRASGGGPLFIAGSSTQPELASQLLAYLLEPDYAKGLAAAMDQPPLDLGVLDQVPEAHAVYRKGLQLAADTCFLAPQPVVRNPDVALATAKIAPIEPGIGELVQGMFSGDVTDMKAQLKTLSDKSNAAREKAIKEAKSDGIEVALDDFAFGDWTPGEDYGKDRY